MRQSILPPPRTHTICLVHLQYGLGYCCPAKPLRIATNAILPCFTMLCFCAQPRLMIEKPPLWHQVFMRSSGRKSSRDPYDVLNVSSSHSSKGTIFPSSRVTGYRQTRPDKTRDPCPSFALAVTLFREATIESRVTHRAPRTLPVGVNI
jgi:hypothetical protein